MKVLIGLKSDVNFKTEPRIPTRVFSRGGSEKAVECRALWIMTQNGAKESVYTSVIPKFSL